MNKIEYNSAISRFKRQASALAEELCMVKNFKDNELLNEGFDLADNVFFGVCSNQAPWARTKHFVHFSKFALCEAMDCIRMQFTIYELEGNCKSSKIKCTTLYCSEDMFSQYFDFGDVSVRLEQLEQQLEKLQSKENKDDYLLEVGEISILSFIKELKKMKENTNE